MKVHVALAYHLGRLNRKDCTWIQQWALGYYILEEQREKTRDERKTARRMENVLEYLSMFINPKMYKIVHKNDEGSDELVEGEFISADDIGKMDAFISLIDAQKQSPVSTKTKWSDWS